MQIQFTGHNLELTQAIQELTTKKLQKLAHHADHIIRAHVTFSTTKHEHTAKATVHLPGHELFASDTSNDLYKSIDGMIHKLLAQLEKHHR